MTSVFGLDEIDLNILDVLQQDGRITVLDLAEKVRLSPTPCGRRLRALEEKGFIEKYVASQREAINSFLRAVKKMTEVQEAYFVTGDYDYLLHVRTESAEAFKVFLVERLLNLPVVHTQSYIVLEQVKHTTALPIPRPTKS